jgi:hypothetical protein
VQEETESSGRKGGAAGGSAPSYAEEQARLRASFLAAAADSGSAGTLHSAGVVALSRLLRRQTPVLLVLLSWLEAAATLALLV